MTDPFAERRQQATYDPFEARRKPAVAAPVAPPVDDGEAGVLDRLGDTGLDFAKGIVDTGESAVGIGDLLTGNLIGRGLKKLGYDPEASRQFLNSGYSKERQQENADVQAAKGFLDTVIASVVNPAVTIGAVVESAPMMAESALAIRSLATKMLTKAGIKTAEEAAKFLNDPKIKTILAAAGGGSEGAMSAGQNQEQARQAGRSYTESAPFSIAAGLGDAAVSTLTGRIPGLRDVDTAIGTAGMGVKSALPAGQRLIRGAAQEGLEETLQSAQEQAFQNLSMGKPWNEGLSEAAAQGLLAGGLMGGGARLMEGRSEAAPLDQIAGNVESVLPPGEHAGEKVPYSPTDITEVATPTDHSIPGIDIPLAEDPFLARRQQKRSEEKSEPFQYPDAVPFKSGVDTAFEQRKQETESEAQAKRDEDYRKALEQKGEQETQQAALMQGEDYMNPAMRLAFEQAKARLKEKTAPATTVAATKEDATATEEPSAPILVRRNGKPFGTKESAKNSYLMRDNPGATVVPVQGGFGVQPSTEAAPPKSLEKQEAVKRIEHIPTNDEGFAAFPKESGTLEIPRTEMPQIKSEARGALTQFFKGRGIDHTQESVPASSLKPTQAEFSPAKVEQAINYKDGDRSILVSSDNYIIDGHHQYMAKLAQSSTDPNVDVIRINAPIKEILQTIPEFPSANMEAPKATTKQQGSKTGTEAVAQRQVNAVNRFIDSAVEQFGVTREQASSAWNSLLKEKLVSVDSVGGQYKLKTGAVWDKDVILRAAGTEASSTIPTKEKGPNSNDLQQVARQVDTLDGYRKAIAKQYGQEIATAQDDNLQAFWKAHRKTINSKVKPDDSILRAIAKLGGLNTAWMQDITGDTKHNHIGLFQKNGTSPDDMAAKLIEEGYMPPEDYNQVASDKPVRAMYEKIRDEIGGRKHYQLTSTKHIDAMVDAHESEQQKIADQQLSTREAIYADIAKEYGQDTADAARQYDDDMLEYNGSYDEAFNDLHSQKIAQERENENANRDFTSEEADAAQSGELARENAGETGRREGSKAAPAPAFGLEQQSPEQVVAQEKTRIAAEKAQQEQAAKDKADAERDSFTLAGSTSKVDQAEARGQNNLFGANPARSELPLPEVTELPVEEVEPAPAIKSANEKELEKLEAQKDNMHKTHMQKYRDGSATRAQTTTHNARVSQLNDRIQSLKAEIKKEKSQAASEPAKAELPPIVTASKPAYLKQMVKAAGLKKDSPGYDNAVKRIEDEYETELDKAYASLPFEQYNELNSEVPESLNRQAYDQLQKQYGGGKDEVLASQDEPDKSLYVAHNTNASKIRHMDELGGLAAPSLAITDINKGAYDSFGDITLLADPQITQSPKARTFNADAYSPRYPQMKRQVNKRIFDRFRAEVEAAAEGNKHLQASMPDISEVEDGGSNLAYRESIMNWYLKKQGINVRLYPNDYAKTLQAVRKKFRTKKLESGLEFALNQELREMTDKKVYFNGYTNSGNRRYAEYNMENIVSKMVKELRGGENFNYGAGNIRAKNAAEMKSIPSIQKRRGEIVSKQEMESVKKAASDKLFQVLDELKPYYKFDANRFGYYDDASNAISEGPRSIREAFNADPEVFSAVRELIDYLTTLPTEYFETKIGRAVGLDEFKAAVVPRGTAQDVIDILTKHGIAIKYYKKGDGQDRVKAVRSIADKQGILFQQDQPQGWLTAEPGEKGMSVEAVKTAVADAVAKLNQQMGVDVVVLNNTSELPSIGKDKPFRGAYSNGTVYLFADNIQSARGAQVVLAHELIGHKGVLEAATPEEWVDIKTTIANLLQNNARFAKEIMAEVDRRYPEASEETKYKEFLALAAERREKRGTIGELVAKVKEILRRFLKSVGLRGPFSESELDIILSNSERYLKQSGAQQQSIDEALASQQERDEYAAALAKGLPMDQESRMARAKEMGFDTSKVWYHGTNTEFEGFQEGKGIFGKGVYLTTDPEAASSYAHKTFEYGAFGRLKDKAQKQGGQNVIPVYVRGNPIHSVNDVGVFKPNQIRSVNAAFDPDFSGSSDLLAANQSPPFYSALLNTVQTNTSSPRNGTADQWKAWLDGRQKAGEIKKAERDWLGLDAWLDSRGPTTRDELANFIEANQVQVQDVMLGGESSTQARLNMLQEMSDETLVEEADDSGVDIDSLDLPKSASSELTAEDRQALIEGIMEAEDMDLGGINEDGGSGGKFAKYQLPGGSNYRELLLTLPPSPEARKAPMSARIENYGTESTPIWTVLSASGTSLGQYGSNFNAAERHVHALNEGKYGGTNTSFNGPHFTDHPNILAHVRFNERTDADGNKVLFLEELQSDWHQAGRKQGYKAEMTPKMRQQIDDLRAQAKAKFNEMKSHVDDADETTFRRLQAERDALNEKRFALEKSVDQGIPNAPFKATDEWAMLAMKRMVRYAADNGFDKIAWTTGEQQADRYDLSKQIDSIAVPTINAQNRAVRVEPKGQPPFRMMVSNEGVVDGYGGASQFSGKTLDEVIGKEMAEKVMAATETTAFSGLDLKVGGEGMRGFYDKILPAAVNKWAKKFGGKVESIEMPGSETKDELAAKVYGRGETYKNLPSEGKRQVDLLFSKRFTGQPALTITPSMREAAESGQPLFSKSNNPSILASQGGSEFEEENRRLREEDKTLWARSKKLLRQQFAPGGLLPESVFDEKLKRDFQFEAAEFDVRHLVGELETAIKKEYGVSTNKLSEADQNALSEALAGRVPESVKPQTKTVLVAMRQYIDHLSGEYMGILQQQANDLVTKAEATGDKSALADANERLALMNVIAGNQGKYVHRSYQAFDDPNWFKRVPEKAVDAARRYLIDQHTAKGETPQEAKRLAEVALHEILKNGTAYGGFEAFIKESKLGAKDLSVLKKRQDIAPEIRALLGEYKDPRLNFAKSATKMARLVWNQRFLDKVQENGLGAFLFKGTDRPPGATTQIAAEGSEVYSPLNGLWTYPEVDKAFKDALGKEKMDNWYKAIVQLNGLVKVNKTILSPTTAARNWQSAMFFSLANGHFDLTQVTKSIAGLREYFANAGDAKKLAYLRELKELGVVYDTPYAGEMMRLLDDSQVENMLTGSTLSLAGRKAFNFAQRFYQYGDDFWKIIGFENEKNMLMKHAGMNEAEAKKEAAERIRNTYPTYSLVGKGIQSLRRFPLVGSFVSFPAEIIRTTFNMLNYVKKDMANPKMRPLAIKRAMGMAFAAGFTYALQALTKAHFDIDDDDEEAIRLQAAPWQKNSNLVFTGRDEQGKLRYVDISFLDPYNYWKRPINAIMRGQPWQDTTAAIGKEVFQPFFGTDILAGTIFDILANKKDSGGEIYKKTDDPDRQLMDITKYLGKAVQPGIMSNLERTAMAIEGKTSPSGQQYNVGDELKGWMGWRATTLDPKTALYYSSFEFNDAKSEASKTLTQVLTNPNDVTKDDISEAYQLSLRMRERAYKDMIKLVNASRRSGMNNAQIRTTLKGSNLSVHDITALMNGTIPSWHPTKQAEKAAFKRAEAILGDKKAQEIRARYRIARGTAPDTAE